MRIFPGSWHAALTPRACVLLAPEVSAQVAEGIWAAMAAADPFVAVFDGLVAAHGTSIGALPAFAIMVFDDDAVRVMVRGTARVRIDGVDGEPHALSGLGVTTWTERTVARPRRVELGVADAEGRGLPVRDGIVAASAVVWAADETAATPPAPDLPLGAAAEPVPVSEATPVPAAAPAPAERAPTGGPTPSEASLTTITALPSDTVGEVDDRTTGYDDLLFGETQLSTSESAAVRDAPDAIPTMPRGDAPAASLPFSDHDGETVSSAALAAQVADAPRLSTAPSSREVTLVVSSGERVVLDRNVVLGRRPEAVRATGSVPRLVTVGGAESGISRSHLEVRREGDAVVATDLGATNGTRLLRVGRDPVRLAHRETVLLAGGDRLDLGDGVELSFEGLP